MFSGLSALEVLNLKDNDLNSLPAGLFSGLTTLTGLVLDHNPNTDDVLALTVTVEKAGTDQARAKVAGSNFAGCWNHVVGGSNGYEAAIASMLGKEKLRISVLVHGTARPESRPTNLFSSRAAEW